MAKIQLRKTLSFKDKEFTLIFETLNDNHWTVSVNDFESFAACCASEDVSVDSVISHAFNDVFNKTLETVRGN